MRRFVEKCQNRRNLICLWCPDPPPVRPNLNNDLSSLIIVFDALSNAAWRLYCVSRRGPQAELEVGVETPPEPQKVQ